MTPEPLRLPDGTAIALREWPVPAGVERRGSLLLVHGLGEHSGRYAHVAERLAALGLHVRAYDLRGHGGSGGARGAIPHPDALLDDLRAMFEDLDDASPRFLLGHSMGGTIAARAATGGWVTPRALILSSPALRVSPSPVEAALLTVARRAAPDRGFPNRLPIDKLSHDPREVAAYRADGLVHDRITPRLYDFLADSGAAARRDAPGLHRSDAAAGRRRGRARRHPRRARVLGRATGGRRHDALVRRALPRAVQRTRAGAHDGARRPRGLGRAAAARGLTTMRVEVG